MDTAYDSVLDSLGNVPSFGLHIVATIAANNGVANADTYQAMILFGEMLSPHYERLLADPAANMGTGWSVVVAAYRALSRPVAQSAAHTVLSLRQTGMQKDVCRLIGRAVYDTRLHDAEAWRVAFGIV